MARYRNDFFNSVVAAVLSVWTEMSANGVYRAAEAARLTLGQKADAGQLPFVAIDFSPSEVTGYGAGAMLDGGLLRIYYVADDSTTLEALMDKLEDLRDALYTDDTDAGLLTGQIMGYPQVSDSLDLPLNSFFLRAQRPYLCGAVTASVQVGQG